MDLTRKIIDYLIDSLINSRWWVAAIITGLMIGGYTILPISVITLPVGIWLFINLIIRRNTNEAYKIGFLALFVKSLLALSWLTTVYPLDWMNGFSPLTQIIFVGFYLLTSAIFISGGFVLGVYLLRLTVNKISSVYSKAFLGSLIWLFMEQLGAFLFSLFTYGIGGVLTTAFSFGFVGYGYALIPGISALAIWGGVYAVSFGGVFLTLLFFQYRLLSATRLLLSGVLILSLVSFLNFYVKEREEHRLVNSKPVNVISVETAFRGDTVLNDLAWTKRFNDLHLGVVSAFDKKPDYVLLPEDSRYLKSQFDTDNESAAILSYRWQLQNPDSIFLDSARTNLGNGKIVLRANILSPGLDGYDVYKVDKHYLVPQGEFMPYFYQTFFNSLGYKRTVKTVTDALSYSPGVLDFNTKTPSTIPAVLFCFESVMPWRAYQISLNSEASFIVHPISHSWFHSPKKLWKQQDTMLRLQAIWSGLPIVSVGNEMLGAVYLPDGRIIRNEREQITEKVFLRQDILFIKK